MGRPHKPNPTPVAPMNLRSTGPMKAEDLRKRLGKGFRIAHGHGDRLATVDAEPCPHCGSPVEWAPTSTTERGKTVQYVYARCQGKAKHAWGFSNAATKRDVVEVVDTTPPEPVRAAPVVETDRMGQWIELEMAKLEAQLKTLQELRRLAKTR